MKMNDDFPYVDSPPHLWRKSPLVEKIAERHYLVKSDDLKFYHWINQLNDAYAGDLIPLQWVASYVGVSRPSVFKRVQNGGLTVFSYEFTDKSYITILGKESARDTKGKFDYAIVSECREWQFRLYDRAMRSDKNYRGGKSYFENIKDWLKYGRKAREKDNDWDV